MTFLSLHQLAHDVVDRDGAALAQHDVELINGGVGIDAHVDRAFHFLHTNTSFGEEFLQVVDDALVEVVGAVFVVALDEGAGFAVHHGGNDELFTNHSSLCVNTLVVGEEEVVGDVDGVSPSEATVATVCGEEFVEEVAAVVLVVLIHATPNGHHVETAAAGQEAKHRHGHAAAVVGTVEATVVDVPFGGIVPAFPVAIVVKGAEVADVFRQHAFFLVRAVAEERP